ncbi:conjugative transposon protein TraM [Albibacterium sp.]|uniref:conjugative transposon protein TraM n=1 Tax=Albibacterium sp. TaxID=2952885 RepID=UPI002C6D99E2|nr:conjugative transposon protein TraM [Albibacterium sp.]HUH19370.1 conjugative transposon protein TraM [Albibacterium sp.]
MKKQSAETLQKRKFLMVLPLLILPFVTLAFWSLGGGKNTMPTSIPENQTGFNMDLPAAKFDKSEKQDKLSIYEASEKTNVLTNDSGGDIFNSLAFPNSNETLLNSNEEKINEKLAEIDAQINSSVLPSNAYAPVATNAYEISSKMSEDVDRLEKLMLSFQVDGGEDKEMEQLNAVLDKIIKIQYPDFEKASVQEKGINTEGGVFAVHDPNVDDVESYRSNAIQATIHEDQDIVSGSVIKLRLLDSIQVNEALIPKNSFIYGVAAIDDERLKIEIASLRYQNSIFPVSLSAYDLDGLAGLYIPGAIARDASKEGINDAIQSIRMMSLDPSLSAQVADAGIHATKGLFRKKVKQVRVKVKAGYQLLLRDKK